MDQMLGSGILNWDLNCLFTVNFNDLSSIDSVRTDIGSLQNVGDFVVEFGSFIRISGNESGELIFPN